MLTVESNCRHWSISLFWILLFLDSISFLKECCMRNHLTSPKIYFLTRNLEVFIVQMIIFAARLFSFLFFDNIKPGVSHSSFRTDWLLFTMVLFQLLCCCLKTLLAIFVLFLFLCFQILFVSQTNQLIVFLCCFNLSFYFENL